MLVVCGWSVWTPPVIWVWHTTWHCCSTPPFSKSHMSLIWDLIWGVIWYHMSSNELIWAQMISYELIWHLIWDLIWAQMRLDRGIEKFEVEKCRWHFSINHDGVKQPAKYEFLIPSSFEVRIWLVNRLSLIFKGRTQSIHELLARLKPLIFRTKVFFRFFFRKNNFVRKINGFKTDFSKNNFVRKINGFKNWFFLN